MPVSASEAKQSMAFARNALDCFGALPLAMTKRWRRLAPIYARARTATSQT